MRDVILARLGWRSRGLWIALAMHGLWALVFATEVERLMNGSFGRGKFWLGDDDRLFFIAICPAAVALSLMLGILASLLAPRGERRLWCDAWARSHLIMYVPLLLLPVSCSLPLFNAAAWWGGLLVSLAACIVCSIASSKLRTHYRHRFLLNAFAPRAAMTAIHILQLLAVLGMIFVIPFAAAALLAITRT